MTFYIDLKGTDMRCFFKFGKKSHIEDKNKPTKCTN